MVNLLKIPTGKKCFYKRIKIKVSRIDISKAIFGAFFSQDGGHVVTSSKTSCKTSFKILPSFGGTSELK